MRSEHLTIAIASDLHAYDEHKGDNKPSHLLITDPEDQPGKHPISGLVKLIEQEDLSADLLLCPGDLSHQAKPGPLKYAWQALHKIKSVLGAELVVATAGNHDLDSRYIYNSFDAKGMLQSLDPPFPLDSDDQNDKFWSRNFVVLERSGYRLVVLNSSAYHGAGENEINHGRVSDATISALQSHLSKLERRTVNILLCHHHPQMHMELGLGDYDTMRNGQMLLDLLGRGSFGRWLIIHGHKHHPKLTYASGSATSPIIFSAGSLSAALYEKLAATVRNQFYLMTLPLMPTPGLGLSGKIRAWDWAPGVGWSKAGEGSGMPPMCGFGFRGEPLVVAERIRSAVVEDKASWKTVISAVPEVDYMMPQDFALLRVELDNLGLVVQDLNGQPYEIGRKVL
jgi:3',5'-cyclic AMP phosphodiesterase CpdA